MLLYSSSSCARERSRPEVECGSADLLRSALCVAYTPHREHFGIVPLEAMYAGSPVVAVDSGGPRETVVHGVTGLLVDGTVGGFASALRIYSSSVFLLRSCRFFSSF